MPDDWRSLIATAGSGGAIGAIVGAARYVIVVEQGGFKVWLRSVVAGILVGVLVSFSIDGLSWTTALKYAIVITAAFLAESVLRIMLILAQHAERNPMQFVRDVVASLRGGYRPAPLPPDKEKQP